MEVAAIIAAAEGVFKLATLAIQAGHDAGPFFQIMADKIGGKKSTEITQDDLDTMAEESEKLGDELMLPLDDAE